MLYSNTARGFSLLEVLIAMFIVTGAFMVLAAAQLNEIRSTQNAYLQSQAANFANNLFEKIRQNRASLDAYLVDSSSYNCTSTPSPFCFANSVQAAASCNASELADSELFVAICGNKQGQTASGGIRQLLPQGVLTIQCIASDGSYGADCSAGNLAIRLNWTDLSLHEHSDSSSRSLEIVSTL